MPIPVSNSPDRPLQDLLGAFSRKGAEQLVVFGGAVRDHLLGLEARDLDVAMRLPLAAPAAVRETACPRREGRRTLTPALAGPLGKLAEILQCGLPDLHEARSYRNTQVDVLGLCPVTDFQGRVFPDIFVAEDDAVFNSTPELTINQIAMDGRGRIWPTAHVEDLIRRRARFTDAPLGIRLRQFLRSILAIRRFCLVPTAETAAILSGYMTGAWERHNVENELEEENAAELLRSVRRLTERDSGFRLPEACGMSHETLDAFLRSLPCPEGRQAHALE
jgi:hypothetical protein